jgi:nucleoside-diphosphate-sugar epimerase
MIGTSSRPRATGLVRVVGDGNNHWPLVYDRDLADLYARVAANPEAAGIYHANDEGDERVNDIVGAIKPYLPVRPDVRYVPIEEARHKMGVYADAMRSIRWSAARGRGRSAGRRRCTRWPATPRACSKSGANRELKLRS